MKNQFSILAATCSVVAVLLTASCGNKSPEADNAAAHDHGAGDHAHFTCPMHPEVTGHEGDKCPKCGMALEPGTDAPKAANFKMDFASTPANIAAGAPTTLAFTPKNLDSPTAAVPLDVEHEKKIHLIVVSEDLSWFAHIHPEYQADGSYTVAETFPNGGNYHLYADYRPSGGEHQLNKIDVNVKGKTLSAKTYSSPSNTDVSGAFSVLLKPDDGVFIANKAIHFDGVFTKNGKPMDVNLLQNYLGAKGHMVAINTETKEYVHLHPEVEGVILHFHTTFEKAGTYRAWLQFMADGELHTTDFTIVVEKGDGKAETEAEHEGHGHDHGDGGHKH